MLHKFQSLFKNFFTGLFLLVCSSSLVLADDGIRPNWWFGVGLGANYNIYDAGFKSLNNNISQTDNFKKGSGFGLFAGGFIEYRPSVMWGGLFNLGFDGRGGKFDAVNNHKLSGSINYLSFEPNLRFNPMGEGLYLFAGPKIGFNVGKSFEYETSAGVKSTGDFSHVRGTRIGGQVGIGYDIPLTSKDATWQIELSPNVSAHFGQAVRTSEKWNNTTIRGGIALKFGSMTIARKKADMEVSFSVKSPMIVPKARKVTETFPARNYIFFDEGSLNIPKRYVQLTSDEAATFEESHLVEPKPQQLAGRAARQMEVYYNVMNILGDRMRRFPHTSVTLSGASSQGANAGKSIAEAVKRYLVSTFEISDSRITTQGQEKPAIPSHQAGGTRDLSLVKAEDNRVDIITQSFELLAPVRIIAAQEDPIDADIVLTVAGAEEVLASWTVEVTDELGKVKNFGPFTSGQERISGNAILGDKPEGDFRIVMVGQAINGATMTKESRIRLARSEGSADPKGLRYSILFEFDQSKTVSTYERFLSDVVVPNIPEGANVAIHGHTDIVGEESHNLTLSRNRATETMNVIQRELNKAGKKNVRFDTYGFGARRAPFENNLPEERFYNRTVIIDIITE